MAEIKEFTDPTIEVVTAAMTLPLATEESYGPPVVIGYYPGADEVWIESEGGRLQIEGRHLNAFIKQLRRARTLALERVSD